MTSRRVDLWGKRFLLEVEYETYDGDEVLSEQVRAVERLLAAWDVVEASLDRLKEYCLSESPEEIASDHIDDIFRYVVPTTLYALRDEDARVVSLLCEYRFDPEHGIALRFEDEKLAEIGTQDIAL